MPAGVTQFHIERCLGKGGYGEVYLARMVSSGGLESRVALKMLQRRHDAGSMARRRLLDEAKVLAGLAHPAIVRVLDLVVVEGRESLVMEYVEGWDLSTCLRAPEPPSSRAVLETLGLVADALDACYHAKDLRGRPLHLLHRDVKPSNIRIGRHGEVKVLDFGIATFSTERNARTETDAVPGTALYMPPERLRDGLDHPSGDVYSLGATLYLALADRSLWGAVHRNQHLLSSVTRDKHDEHVLPAVRELGTTPQLQSLLHAALAYDPEERLTLRGFVERCEALATTMEGPSLRQWCRSAPEEEVSVDDVRVGETLTVLEEGDSGAGGLDGTTVLRTPPVVEEQRAGWLPLAAAGLVAFLVAGGAVGALGCLGLPYLFGAGRPERSIEAGSPEPRPAGGPASEPEPRSPPAVDEGAPKAAPPPAEPVVGLPTPTPAEGLDPPGAPMADVAACADPGVHEGAASRGALAAEVAACLDARMRLITLKQTERQQAARVLLVNAEAGCAAGEVCVPLEALFAYHFEELGRSDPDLMASYARRLANTGTGVERARAAMLWGTRALERKDVWRGRERLERELELLALRAKMANRVWVAEPTEAHRMAVRDASVEWAERARNFGRSDRDAVALCASATGSAESCGKRITVDEVTHEITFVSIPPRAEVFVDGERLGSTPLSRPVGEGARTLRMVAGEASSEQTIHVGAGEPVRWTWTVAGDTWNGSR